MSREPVSWLVIERGWPVLAADGSEVGRVEEVMGDEEKDIFNGLVVQTGFFTTSYVPAERVVEIRDGEIEIEANAADG